MTFIAGAGNLRRREKFRGPMRVRGEKRIGGHPCPSCSPARSARKTNKHPFLLVKIQVYSVQLIVLHKFSVFFMNALSLPSQRAKKSPVWIGERGTFFIDQKWNVTGYFFGPYIGRAFFAPFFFGTTLSPTSTTSCCGLIQLILVSCCRCLVEVCWQQVLKYPLNKR